MPAKPTHIDLPNRFRSELTLLMQMASKHPIVQQRFSLKETGRFKPLPFWVGSRTASAKFSTRGMSGLLHFCKNPATSSFPPVFSILMQHPFRVSALILERSFLEASNSPRSHTMVSICCCRGMFRGLESVMHSTALHCRESFTH